MEPAMHVNDLVLLELGSESFQSLRIGDIIVFSSPDGVHGNISHRIIDITSLQDGTRVVTTKGDANPSPIPGVDTPITEHEYLGKVLYVIREGGIVVEAFKPPVAYIIIGLVVSFLAVAIFVVRRMEIRNKKANSLDGSQS